MANYVSPGRPFYDVGGANYPRPNEEDLEHSRMQGAGLIADAQLQAVHRRLIRNRQDQPAGLLHPTEAALLRQLIDETGQPLLTLTEIVVRTDDLEGRSSGSRDLSMRELLADFHLREESVSELDGRVTLLFNRELSTGELALAVEMLRRAGFQASMNQIEPLGYVTKDDPNRTGAENTQRRVEYPAKRKPTRWPKVVVAVIDTGLSDQSRSDRWLERAEAGREDTDPLFEGVPAGPDGLGVFDLCAGHGTFVAGVVQQVAPHATLRVRRAVGRDGIGSDVDVAIAMVQAVDEGAQILNLSLGTETPHDVPPVATQVALEIIAERCEADSKRDVVVVAAAGNNGNSRPVFPAAFSSVSSVRVPVVAVGGLSVEFEPTDFSSRGFWVDCSTAAECVLSTFVRGRETEEIDPQQPDKWTGQNPWAVWSGTSFAAPQISGAIARRCQEARVKPSEALAWLLRQGPTVPDFGTSLEILPGR
jgi:Subtilase family